jgi:hypothetical protein
VREGDGVRGRGEPPAVARGGIRAGRPAVEMFESEGVWPRVLSAGSRDGGGEAAARQDRGVRSCEMSELGREDAACTDAAARRLVARAINNIFEIPRGYS